MPGEARRCAVPATRPARSPWNRRSTNWRTSWGSIRWHCASASTQARCGARNAGIGAQRIGWERRHKPGADAGVVRRGLGVAQSLWGANVQSNAACEVRLLRDGSLEVLSSVQDLGTGIGTILAQVVAEEFGVRPEDITVRIGDTEFPAGPPSNGSRTTASITPPARTAAWKVKQMLFRQVAPALGVTPDQLVARDGRIVVRDDPARSMSLHDAAAGLRTDQISAIEARSDDYGGFRRTHGRRQRGADRSRRRAVRRGGGGYRDRRRSASNASSRCRIAAGR